MISEKGNWTSYGKRKTKKKGILKERKESVQGKEIVIKKIAKKARRNDNKKGKKISVIYVENSTRETDQADFIKKKNRRISCRNEGWNGIKQK